MNKEVNVYSFYDECYVYLADYKELQQENKQLKEELKYTVPIVEHNKIVSKKLKENQKYKEAIDKAINNSQYWIDYYTRLNSDERIALRLQENIDILKEVE